MAVLIELDENGKKVYRGFLSSEETRNADLLLGLLQDEIPKIGQKLSILYGNGVLYKYYMGKRLSELLDEYRISEKERVYFWDEIKNFASDKERKREDGGEAKTRKFYEQCYRLSQIDLQTVKKLSWRQWQDLLDRTQNRVDDRIFIWIGIHEPKIKEAEWRAFEKALNIFLKKKDSSVFSDQELFDLYEMILMMGQCWIEEFNNFAKSHPKSMKIKTKGKWENKYYTQCFIHRKVNKSPLKEDDCKIIFCELMNETIACD